VYHEDGVAALAGAVHGGSGKLVLVPLRDQRNSILSALPRQPLVRLKVGSRAPYAILRERAIVLLAGLWLSAGLWAAPADAPAAPGKLIAVGDHKLHLLCEGAGSPAVILQPGTAEFSFDWDLVQHKLAKTTRVCTYDRAGYAWSDMSSAFERFGPTAENLHDLLQKAGVNPPYILAGHGFGALYIRDYQRRYPAQVAGMLLIDPTPEEDNQGQMFGNTVSLIDMADHDLVSFPLRPFVPSRTTLPPRPPASPDTVSPPFDRLPAAPQSARQWALARFFHELDGLTSAEALAVVESQRATFDELYKARHNPQTILDLPVVILSRGLGTTAEVREMQVQLTHLSRNTTHLIAEKCGTQIHIEDPGMVSDAILRLLGK
jgi:pimeloyl-ACP methyl ester carboxylesterase